MTVHADTASRVPRHISLFSPLLQALLAAGLPVGPNALITIRGRKSGEPRTAGVAIIEVEGRRWIWAPWGEVNWVRNLRAAGQATLTRGGHCEPISAIELTPAEAAPVLKWALASVPSFIRSYFDVTADSSLEAIEQEAPRHPIFRVLAEARVMG